jgi:hypothetical protein
MKDIIRNGRRVLGHLHVPIGISEYVTTSLLVFACICFSIMASCDAWAADLPVASGPGWTTNAFFFAKPNATSSVTFFVDQYLTGKREVTVEPMGAVVVPLTVPAGFGTLPAPQDVESFVQLKYDGKTKSSYTLGGISPTKAGKYIPTFNDGVTITVVTSLCKVPTPLTILPRNSHGQPGMREYTGCVPPASQYTVQQEMNGGSLDVNVGNLPFDDGSAWPAAYIIVTVGKPDRDAFVVPQR